jgi:hypothetical protein
MGSKVESGTVAGARGRRRLSHAHRTRSRPLPLRRSLRAPCSTLFRGPNPALRRQLLLTPAATAILCALTNNHGIGLLAGCVFGAAFAALRRPVTEPYEAGTRHTPV